MIDQTSVTGTDAPGADASAALLADQNQMPGKQAPSQSWLSTIVDYVPDKLGAPKVVSNLLPTLVKTAALFYPGVAGAAGYVAMSALDQAHPADSLTNQAEDLALGATKGALMAGAFRATAAIPTSALGLAGRGVSLGVASRFLDSGLNRNTYVGQNGAFDWGGGAANVLKTTFQPGALAIDAVTFTVAGGLAKEANVLTNGALATNYAASNAITGGIFGFSSGAFGELRQEQEKNQSFSPLSVLGQGLESGAVMAVAAIPGGMKMQSDFTASQAQARPQSDEQPSSSAGRPAGRIIPGPGRSEHTQQAQRFYAHVADDQPGSQPKVVAMPAGEQSAVDKATTNDAAVVASVVPAVDTSRGVEVRMDEGGNVVFNSGKAYAAEVNGTKIPRGQDFSIKPGDHVEVDVGDNFAVWKTVSLGNVGRELTVEGYPLTPGHSVRFDYSSLVYGPQAQVDGQGTISLTRSPSFEGSTLSNYHEPTSSIRVGADGQMTLSPGTKYLFKLNGQPVSQADTPIQPGDAIQAHIGEPLAEWKTLQWGTIGNKPVLEGRSLSPGRQLQFDRDTLRFSPIAKVDSDGNLVLTGPKVDTLKLWPDPTFEGNEDD